MYISVHRLHHDMGVDKTIARFFVDRKIPEGNAFWRNRLLYIGRGNGFISIPVYYDLLFRTGVPKELLLDESHVQLMEQIMHYAILVEFGEMDFNSHLEMIKKLFEGRIKNPAFYKELLGYIEQPVLKPQGRLGMPVPALNRADVFLFVLCDLPLTEAQTNSAIAYWYALHTSYLLMDDIADYEKDKQKGEENSILELGEGQDGFNKAFDLLKRNSETLSVINPVLAQSFEERMEDLHELVPLK